MKTHNNCQCQNLGVEKISDLNFSKDDVTFAENLAENLEIFVIDNLPSNDWKKPIVEYLENATGTTDRKTKYRALNYTIIGNELFKRHLKVFC
jgi:hypothetical protein